MNWETVEQVLLVRRLFAEKEARDRDRLIDLLVKDGSAFVRAWEHLGDGVFHFTVSHPGLPWEHERMLRVEKAESYFDAFNRWLEAPAT